MKQLGTVLGFFLPLLAAIGPAAADDPPSLGDRLEAAAAYVKVEGLDTNNKPSVWSGSGICVLPGGWVVTNRHVAPGNCRTANVVRVTFLAGTTREVSGAAEVVLSHPERDLSLLKCDVAAAVVPVVIRPTANQKLTEQVTCVGFPLGELVAVRRQSPSVSIVPGSVSALRREPNGLLWWIDVAAAVAGGNSGSAVVDSNGALIGIVAQRYEGFGRAVPVEFVHELLGEAALDVQPKPSLIEDGATSVSLTVKPRGPASKLTTVSVSPIVAGAKATRLTGPAEGPYSGDVRLVEVAAADRARPLILRVQASDETGAIFERLVSVPRKGQAGLPLKGVLHSVLLKPKKANGWSWDFGPPDPRCRVYVNDILVHATKAAENQFRFLTATEFDCAVGDRIRIVVEDEDEKIHDHAGVIEFVAEADATITRPTSGQLENCDVTLRAVPARLPATP